MKEVKVSQEDAGQRFDKYLHKLLINASTGFLYKMMRKKNITLNRKKATGKESLQAGDQIQIFFSDETFDKMCGRSEKASYFQELQQVGYPHVHVIYEDVDILVMNKPAGVLSQKSEAGSVSLNEEMLSYLIHTKQISEESFQTFHPSVANRLDRNTSGLILAGKTLKGQQYLSACLKDRTVKKLYHCIVRGSVQKEQYLEGYLVKGKDNHVMISDKEQADAKLIKTEYRPIKFGKEASLLEVHLITGRTHQIRAHLAEEGHGILGDPKYGGSNESFVKRFHYRHQLLHAYSITFPDGKSFVAPEPEIFQTVCEAYGLK